MFATTVNVTADEMDICKEIMEKDIAVVSVNLESKKYVRSIMDKKITFVGQLAALGGTLGLFTGMSILSMVEMVFWMFKLLPVLFRRIGF